MTFTSFAFLAFFPIAVALYYCCPPRFRWAFLLLASCYFYMAFIPKYIIILFALIAIDYTMARLIEGARGKRRKAYLIVSILSTVSILFVFKYFNFFAFNIGALAHFFHWQYSFGLLALAIPLGLSFHTFQSLSYVIEVYRGTYTAERHVGIYALYVLFFPQLIAGPIERPQHLLPQLKIAHNFSLERASSGVRLMLWGYFKKLVIADRLGMSVDYVWANFTHLPGLSVLFAIIFFAFQLYADFSGYSDIARGAARVLGIDLAINFEQPYFSASIAEFWRRWHMTLSSWFRDYLFTPLGLSLGRWGRIGAYAAILATFTIMGLWHGAGWTYITMGFLFGMYIVLDLLTKAHRMRFMKSTGLFKYASAHRFFKQGTTFLLVAITWVFFRSPKLSTALLFIGQIFTGWHLSFSKVLQEFFALPFANLGISQTDLIIGSGALAVLLGIEHFQQKRKIGEWFNVQPIAVKAFLFSSLTLAVVLFSVVSTKQFIYFQF